MYYVDREGKKGETEGGKSKGQMPSDLTLDWDIPEFLAAVHL